MSEVDKAVKRIRGLKEEISRLEIRRETMKGEVRRASEYHQQEMGKQSTARGVLTAAIETQRRLLTGLKDGVAACNDQLHDSRARNEQSGRELNDLSEKTHRAQGIIDRVKSLGDEITKLRQGRDAQAKWGRDTAEETRVVRSMLRQAKVELERLKKGKDKIEKKHKDEWARLEEHEHRLAEMAGDLEAQRVSIQVDRDSVACAVRDAIASSKRATALRGRAQVEKAEAATAKIEMGRAQVAANKFAGETREALEKAGRIQVENAGTSVKLESVRAEVEADAARLSLDKRALIAALKENARKVSVLEAREALTEKVEGEQVAQLARFRASGADIQRRYKELRRLNQDNSLGMTLPEGA